MEIVVGSVPVEIKGATKRTSLVINNSSETIAVYWSLSNNVTVANGISLYPQQIMARSRLYGDDPGAPIFLVAAEAVTIRWEEEYASLQ